MDYETLQRQALKTINSNLAYGNCFIVKDLFTGTVWEQLDKGEKIGFGRFFANEVKEGNIPHVIRDGKTTQNHAKYKKI